MTTLPPDHPDRRHLADEVHARPPEALTTPMRATHVAVLVDAGARAAEYDHLAGLCARFGVEPPGAEAIHFAADVGPVRLRWERHGEFSSYTFLRAGRSPIPFSEPPVDLLPAGWLAEVPGKTIFAAHAKIIPADAEDPTPEFLAEHFEGHAVIGSAVGDGAALAFTDFRQRPDGFSRFLILDRDLTPRQAGRTLQRLLEIETYRMMAMLALPLAREQSRKAVGVEQALAALTADIAQSQQADEALLGPLTRLAAEVESSLTASQYRFGAARAYADLVERRIAELRERRLPGVQTIEEFMNRRFTPAAATCASTAQRLHDLSERVAQASALLSTRVEILRERQNQELLGSMNRRATLQLRLQRTVEILSVAPLTYYVVAIVGYAARGAHEAGAPILPDIVEGASIPVVAALIVWAILAAHHRVFGKDHEAKAGLEL